MQVKRDPFIRTVLTAAYDGLSCYGKMSEEVLEKTVVVRNVSRMSIYSGGKCAVSASLSCVALRSEM